jgi:hypothetical protein
MSIFFFFFLLLKNSLLINGMTTMSEAKCLYISKNNIREIIGIDRRYRHLNQRDKKIDVCNQIKWINKSCQRMTDKIYSILFDNPSSWSHSFHFYILFYIRCNIHSASQTNCSLSISIKSRLNIFFLTLLFLFLSWRPFGDYKYVSHEYKSIHNPINALVPLFFLSLVLLYQKFNIDMFYTGLTFC